MGDRAIVGEKVYTLINKQGLRVAWVAEKLGITASALYKKLTGQVDFTREQIKALAEILRLTKAQTIEIFLS